MAMIPGVGFVCSSDDMHPYECRSGCIHCAGLKTDDMDGVQGHDPKQCWLCCDGDPNAVEK